MELPTMGTGSRIRSMAGVCTPIAKAPTVGATLADGKTGKNLGKVLEINWTYTTLI